MLCKGIGKQAAKAIGTLETKLTIETTIVTNFYLRKNTDWEIPPFYQPRKGYPYHVKLIHHLKKVVLEHCLYQYISLRWRVIEFVNTNIRECKGKKNISLTSVFPDYQRPPKISQSRTCVNARSHLLKHGKLWPFSTK